MKTKRVWDLFCNKCKAKIMTSENVNCVKTIICENCNKESVIGGWSESKYCIECCEELNICPECGEKK